MWRTGRPLFCAKTSQTKRTCRPIVLHTHTAHGRTTAPKDTLILIPRTYEYVPFQGERGFADLTKFSTLSWSLAVGRVFLREMVKQERQRQMGAKVGGVHSVDGGRGEEPRNTGALWKLAKSREQAPSLSLQREHSSTDILILGHHAHVGLLI